MNVNGLTAKRYYGVPIYKHLDKRITYSLDCDGAQRVLYYDVVITSLSMLIMETL